MSGRWSLEEGGRIVGAVETTGDGKVKVEIVEPRRGQLRRFGTRRTLVAGPEMIEDLRRKLGMAIGVARSGAGAWGTCPECTTTARCSAEQWCSKRDVEDREVEPAAAYGCAP